MRGRHVARKGGWDCHGLPVEVEVEKELGFTGKHEIEAFGIGEFNQRAASRCSATSRTSRRSPAASACGSTPTTPTGRSTTTTSSRCGGCSARCGTHGDIYEGHKVVPYCGRCGTALSSHELGHRAYQDVTEPSVYVRFPLVDRDFDLLVWTTTPWTLISNVAAAVGPDVDYVRGAAPERRLTRPRAGRGARRRRARRRRRGASARSRSPTWSASTTSGRSTSCHIDADGGRRGRRRRLRDHRRRVGHRAPRTRVRRDRPRGRRAPKACPCSTRSIPTATFDDTRSATTPWAGTFVKDADPAHHRRPRARPGSS